MHSHLQLLLITYFQFHSLDLKLSDFTVTHKVIQLAATLGKTNWSYCDDTNICSMNHLQPQSDNKLNFIFSGL